MYRNEIAVLYRGGFLFYLWGMGTHEDMQVNPVNWKALIPQKKEKVVTMNREQTRRLKRAKQKNAHTP